MLAILLARLAEWRAYRKTYKSLRRLDSTLRADLGLTDIDLDRISRIAARKREMHVSVRDLLAEYYGEDIRKPAKFKARGTEDCPPAETVRYAEAC